MSRGMLWVGLALLCGMALWWGRAVNVTADEEAIPSRSTRPASTRSTTSQSAETSRSTRTSSDSGGREARIEAKLDQVLANQDQILAMLDEVMAELKIVKIRATVR